MTHRSPALALALLSTLATPLGCTTDVALDMPVVDRAAVAMPLPTAALVRAFVFRIDDKTPDPGALAQTPWRSRMDVAEAEVVVDALHSVLPKAQAVDLDAAPPSPDGVVVSLEIPIATWTLHGSTLTETIVGLGSFEVVVTNPALVRSIPWGQGLDLPQRMVEANTLEPEARFDVTPIAPRDLARAYLEHQMTEHAARAQSYRNSGKMDAASDDPGGVAASFSPKPGGDGVIDPGPLDEPTATAACSGSVPIIGRGLICQASRDLAGDIDYPEDHEPSGTDEALLAPSLPTEPPCDPLLEPGCERSDPCHGDKGPIDLGCGFIEDFDPLAPEVFSDTFCDQFPPLQCAWVEKGIGDCALEVCMWEPCPTAPQNNCFIECVCVVNSD